MSILAHGGRPAVMVIRWMARALSVPLFLVWGAFFVGHLFEYFGDPRGWPPAWVFGITALHAGMLLGLLAGWRWEVAGAVVSIVASTSFFFLAARPQQAWVYAGVTALPGLLWLIAAAVNSLTGGAAKPAAPAIP